MSGDLVTTPKQMELDLRIAKEVEIDGVGMGVLSDGTPYLTARGLARMCGIDHTMVLDLANRWIDNPQRPREAKIKSILAQRSIYLELPCIPIDAEGVMHHAYTDTVCMAVLEYYAFEAGSNCKPQALKNFRLLAANSFREFIYTQVGYDPKKSIPIAWQQFHDRVSLVFDNVPPGYFSIFKELSDIIVTLIRGGAQIGAKFIPDISVGQHWSAHWTKQGLEAIYGDRRRYRHDYPDYFPQAESNPQTPYCYPDAALPEFRRWMREVYLPEKFPGYLKSKERQGALPPSFSELALAAIEEKNASVALPPASGP